MNFEPDIILAPLHGNNADAKSVSISLVGQQHATEGQWTALAAEFEAHKTALRHSLAGFHVTHGVLPDGSPFEIVSNSGMHTLSLQPVGRTAEPELVEKFWGIPSSLTSVDSPGGSWRVRDSDRSMPSKLSFNPGRAQDASDSTAHPGAITWSSPKFLADRHEIVVSWRGPRARYTASNGWVTAGEPFTHHALSAYDYESNLGKQVFKDSSYVWINDKKKSTPVNKVIAAALHCPDPVNAPGMVVLRVITDNLSNDNVTRSMGAKDLVPTGATEPVSIAALVDATALVTLNTYTYANEGTGSEQWRMWQRPHFDDDGARIATFVTGSQGTGPAALDATTGGVVQLESLDGTDIRGGGQSISDAGSGDTGEPRTIVIDRTVTSDVTLKRILAVDFLDNTLVWCWTERQRVATYTVNESETSEMGGPYELDASISYVRDETHSVKHSMHGTLRTSTHRHEWTSSYTDDGPLGTFSGSVDPPTDYVAFTGDLSRDVLVFGYSVTNGFEQFAASSSEIHVYDGSLYTRSILTDGQDRSQPHVFDVWWGGLQRVSGTTGSFANGDSTLGAIQTSTYDAIVLQGYIAQYKENGNVLEPPEISTTSVAPETYRSGGLSNPNDVGEPAAIRNSVVWHHCAVNARSTVAYLASYHHIQHGSDVDPDIEFGIEAICFLPEQESFVLAGVPAYASGSRPTVSAPVFPGTRRNQ